MTVRKFGFEGGTPAASISTSYTPSGDTVWGAVAIGAGASLVYNATHVATGTMAAKLTPAANQTVMRWTVTSHTSGSIRLAVWLDALPTLGTWPIWFGSTTSAAACYLEFLSTGHIRLHDAAGANAYTSTGTAPLSAGALLWIDFHYEIGTSGKLRAAVYNAAGATLVDSGDITANTGTAGVTFVRIGKYGTENNTSAMWLDSIHHDDAATALLGPLTSNAAPTLSLSSTLSTIHPGETSTITATASDSDGTIASLSWSTTAGSLSGSGTTRALLAPPSLTDQTATVQVIATDNGGATDTKTINVTLKASMSKMFNGTSWLPLVERRIV